MNKFLLAGYKFMPEIHSKQPGSTYSTCGPFIKNKERNNKAFEIACDTKYDDFQRGLASMVYMFFDKKSSGAAIKAKPNYQLGNELRRQIVRKIFHLLETIFGVLIQLICNP